MMMSELMVTRILDVGAALRSRFTEHLRYLRLRYILS